MTPLEIFRANLKRKLVRKQWKAEDLFSAVRSVGADVAFSTVFSWVRETQAPSLENIAALAAALDCTPNDLLLKHAEDETEDDAEPEPVIEAAAQ